MIDLRELELTLALANAGRHIFRAMCNCAPGEPEMQLAFSQLESAVGALEAFQNPPPKECKQEPIRSCFIRCFIHDCSEPAAFIIVDQYNSQYYCAEHARGQPSFATSARPIR